MPEALCTAVPEAQPEVIQLEVVQPEVIQSAIPDLELPFFDESYSEAHPSAGNSLETFAAAMKVSGVLASLDWPELKQRVQGCHRCDLREGCTQTVFGVGCEQADWMFVGEAPGLEEDTSGEPFVGHAGRLLDNMLLAIRLKRSEAYIATVIKCRPEDDRHPHVGEISSCLPYLQRQIGLVQPKLIVALGKTAATALLDTDASIASLRGTVHDYKGIPLIVTYHPAYLLRSPMEKAKAWQDLCLAVQTMQGLSV
jgi:DNA polymerase